MTAIQAVIFDLGGTLLHYNDPDTDDQQRHFRRVTHQGVVNVYQHLLEIDPGMEQRDDISPVIDHHIGGALRKLMPDLRSASIETIIWDIMAELGAQLDDEQWAEVRHLFYTEIDKIVHPREGLQETIKTLHMRDYQLALISNTFWAADLHDRHMDEHGILDYFPLRVYSCDVEFVKPHPSIFNDMLAALDIDAAQAVYVGDRLDADVEGAQGVGMGGILIHSPYRHETFDRIITPDATISELPELPAALQQIEEVRT